MGRERPRPFKSLIGVGEGGEIGVQAQEEALTQHCGRILLRRKCHMEEARRFFFPPSLSHKKYQHLCWPIAFAG